MTDTTLTWIGIIGQGFPLLMMVVYAPLVNWRERQFKEWMEWPIPEDELYECEM